MKLKLIRNVTKKECSWLDRDYLTGEEVFEYSGHTYGCISSGIACSEQDGETPFFELPIDSF